MATVVDGAVQRLRAEGLLAVLRAPSAARAVAAARALAEGGIRAIEVTYSTPDAPSAIRELAADPTLIVGAGTVLDADQAERALEAGAAFLVSPSLAFPVLDIADAASALAIPGALTPTEVVAAAERAPVVKLFPASVVGPGYLRALLAPLPDLRVLPTGGVIADNVADWRAAGAFALGAGGDLCPGPLIAAGELAALTENARRYRRALDHTQG